MACPKPEVLSQWADGTLPPREAAVMNDHARRCTPCRRKAEELRAVGSWLGSVVEPGPRCLRVEDMAALLEGGHVPQHVRTCPRCSSEFRALRQPEKRATRRRQKPTESIRAWVAAAAVFLAVGILFLLASQETPSPGVVAAQRPAPPAEAGAVPQPLPPSHVPPASPPERVESRSASRPEKPVVPEPAPAPPPVGPVALPVVIEPSAPPAAAPPREPVPATHVEPPRSLAALSVHSGGLSALTDGKWVKTSRFEEGAPVRAEGRTQIDFSHARLTLEAATRFSVSQQEFTLSEGSMSGEVASGSRFTLVLGDLRIVPDTDGSRVMFSARPDRIVIEEGSARTNEAVLREGVEHLVKRDRMEPQRRRTLPAALRSREVLTWRLNLSNESLVRKNLGGGHLERDLPEGRMLVSDAAPGNPFMYGLASFFSGIDEPSLFTVRNNTAIRFHYYLTQPTSLEICLKNATKDENFNKVLHPVAKQWTTATLYAREVPVNGGGKKVTCEVGDRYSSISWFVGRPGTPAEVYIDRLEVLEIER